MNNLATGSAERKRSPGPGTRDEGCKKTKEAGDALQACLSGLSCEELKTSNAMNQKCAQELADVAVAALSELSTCKASNPDQTSSSSSSGGGGAGGADGSSSSSSAGGGGGAGGAGSSSSSSGI